MEDKRQNVIDGRNYIYNEINRLPGLRAYPSEGNFVLIDASVLDKSSLEIRDWIAARGIFIRPMSGHHMPKGFIRITVGTPEQNRRFIEIFKDYIQEVMGKQENSVTQKKYIISHDVGTGGNKAVICDLNGQVLYSNYLPYGISYPNPEWVEQDPDELWRAVAASTRKVIQESGIDPQEILGVGISAQMWNTLPVDEQGTPLMPMMSWLDLRSVKQADRVGQGEMAAFIYKHTGNIPTAKDSIPKILWLKEERPEIWERTAYLVGLQRIYPVQADRKDCHRLGGGIGLLLVQPVHQALV